MDGFSFDGQWAGLGIRTGKCPMVLLDPACELQLVAGGCLNMASQWHSVMVNVPYWMLVTAFLIFPTIALLTRPTRRKAFRRRHDLCIKCGYNLAALTERRCPECGTGF
jgi:hypothetical protein